jgi:hypothetical protein
MRRVTSGPMFDGNATATGGSEAKTPWGQKFTITVESAVTAGSGTSVTQIQISNNTTRPTADADWDTLGTVTFAVLSTAKSVDTIAVNVPYRWVRANVTTIGGTNAWVQAYLAAVGP